MFGTVAIQEAVLSAIISPQINLVGSIRETANLIGNISIPVDYETYVGPYGVIPNISGQVLSTEDKHLSRDITIQAIPYYEVSNMQGGITVTIGGI